MKNDNSSRPALPPDAQARIGVKLRQIYDSLVEAPVPDRFTELLDRLQSATSQPAQSSDAAPSGGETRASSVGEQRSGSTMMGDDLGRSTH